MSQQKPSEYLRKFIGAYDARSMAELRQEFRAKHGAPQPKPVRTTYPKKQYQNFRADKTARAMGKASHA